MELISAAIGILGVIIGWLLNELTTIFRGRPKLCFQMVATPENELTEKEYRVKESFSEHGIEIFNVGEKPFVLENFVISYKKKILVDCQMEYFEECQVTAISIEKKKAKGILQVPLFAIRSNIRSIGINKKE